MNGAMQKLGAGQGRALGAGLLRAYWITARPYLLPVSGASGLAGLATVRDLPAARLATAALVFFLAYGLGQALTDVTQTDTDAISAPYRPLVRGEIGRREVVVGSAFGLVVCCLVLFFMSPCTVVLAAISVAGVATYTPMKRRFWGGPAHNSWIVALLPAIGALCGGPSSAGAAASAVVWALMASTLFSYASFVLLGYLKDVEADRATGYCTLPVRYGRRTTVAVSAACAGLALAASLTAISMRSALGGFAWGIGAGGWAVGALAMGAAHVRARGASCDALAHPCVVACLRGYVALHLGEAVLLRPALWGLALAMYAWLEVALVRRPCREQV